MKSLALLVAVLSLVSCNTMIGLGRDTKEGYVWTKTKWQESRQTKANASQADPYGDPYGAPVY